VDPRRGEALRPGDAGPTLAGIARQAGVSVSTVSKVLNGGTDVAPATREAVQRLLTEMGYQRPRASRRVSRGNLVDLLINEIDSAWAMALIGGVEEVVDDAGFSLVLTAAHHRAPVVSRWFESLLDRGSLGAVVMHSDLTDEQQAELLRRGMPFVLCDPPVELSRVPEQIPAVGVANTEGARMATAHLIELGHTRIAAIGGPQRVASARARLAGYRQALADAGIPSTPPRSARASSRARPASPRSRSCSGCPSCRPRSWPATTSRRPVRWPPCAATRSPCPSRSAWSGSTTRTSARGPIRG